MIIDCRKKFTIRRKKRQISILYIEYILTNNNGFFISVHSPSAQLKSSVLHRIHWSNVLF